jgi:hypothetical protein
MKAIHEQDEVTVRRTPAVPYVRIGWLALLLVVVATAGWEWRMRALGLRAGDLDDGAAHWIAERRRVEAFDHDGVVILGSSRILFDTDLDVWEEMTGRRPIQLALPGTSPRLFLERFAQESSFAGLVIIGITPGAYFSEFTTAFPEYLEANDSWHTQSPSVRFGHEIGLLLSRFLAFLDDNYRLGTLIERIDLPDRDGVNRPFMNVWKLSESFPDRQTRMWPRLESDPRLLEHAQRVWMLRDRGRPGDELLERIVAESRRDIEKIRARGGEVVFVRAPAAGPLLEREKRNTARAVTWDRLLRETGSFGIHFEDYPAMRGLEVPEWSHLSRDSATRFTRAYVDVLLSEGYVGLRTPPEAEPAG